MDRLGAENDLLEPDDGMLTDGRDGGALERTDGAERGIEGALGAGRLTLGAE